ncbi:MAG TPA: 6-carboxytetrahydropterin synthase [Ktedonobacterales bacterium]
MSWKIVVERGNLGFSAAHFITFANTCEPLHGHNYGVRVEAVGELTSDAYVLDFIVLKDCVRALCKEWDHRFLMPLHNPHLTVRETPEDEWEIRVDERTRYLMPRGTVVPLAIDNATAERLAEQLARRIADRLDAAALAPNLTQLTVGIEETSMQAAFYTLDLARHRAARSGPG